MNQYEALAALESALDAAHEAGHGLLDNVFAKADAFLQSLKAQLPEAEVAGMGAETETSVDDKLAYLVECAKGTFMEGPLNSAIAYGAPPENLVNRLYDMAKANPALWR